MKEIHRHVYQFGDKKFMETGTVFDKGGSGRPTMSEENFDPVRNRVPS